MNNDNSHIVIDDHAVDAWMRRTGTKKRDQAKKRLRGFLTRAQEVELKPQYKAVQLLNHNFREARYFEVHTLYNGQKWLLVVVNNRLITVHNGASKNGANRWQKPK